MRCLSTLGFRRTRWTSWEQDRPWLQSRNAVQRNHRFDEANGQPPSILYSGDLDKTRRVHLIETVRLPYHCCGCQCQGYFLSPYRSIQTRPSRSTALSQGSASYTGRIISIIFILTLLASGLSASALGTIAGQVIMEGLIGKHWNVWVRRIITRGINVFPVTLAILLGLDTAQPADIQPGSLESPDPSPMIP